MKLRSVDIQRLLEICPGLENRLSGQFDDMLWELMQNAAENTQLSIEPKFSCLIPNLPNFHPLEEDKDGDLYEIKGGDYVKTPRKSEIREQQMKEGSGILTSFFSFFQTSVDEKKAKGETYLLKFDFQQETFSNLHYSVDQNFFVNEEGNRLSKKRTFSTRIGLQ